MGDQHRSRKELFQEVTALRKQVADLRQAARDRQRVEAALRESEARYRSWLEALPVPTARITVHGAVAAANDALGRLLDYADRAELLELAPVLGVFAHRAEEERIVARLAERTCFRDATALRTKAGRAVAVELELHPIEGDGGWIAVVRRGGGEGEVKRTGGGEEGDHGRGQESRDGR
jgi:PAS domain S-box-containing protein